MKPALGFNFDLETFNNRIGQQLAGHGVNLFLGLAGIGFGQLHFYNLAHAHLTHLGKAQIIQGVADSLALRVEYTIFEHDRHDGLHYSKNPFNIGILLHGLRALQVTRPSLGQNTQTPCHFLIGFFDLAEIPPKSVFIHFFVGLGIP